MPEKRITVYILEPKDRPFYKLEWVEPGTYARRSKSTKTRSRARAERQRRDLERELNQGRGYGQASDHGPPPAPKPMAWAEFRKTFEEEFLAGRRETTRDKYRAVLDTLEELAHPTKLADVNERLLSRFLAQMRVKPVPGGKVGLAPYSQRGYLVCVKTALRWAIDQRLLAQLPRFPSVVVPKKRPQPISETDWELLLAEAKDPLWRAYLLCGWWGGLRLSEAAQLRRASSTVFPWLDLATDRIVLPAAFSKVHEDQWIPVHATLRAALEALPATEDKVFPFVSTRTGEPLTRSAITNKVIEMAKRAGVKLSMHRLRKGFGCRIAKQLGNGNAPVLHRLMRHSKMQMTMDFYASVDDTLQDAINQLK